MEGSWSQQSTNPDNSYKFNGIERNEDFGLNWDMAEFRSYDPAIGRWHQIDPLAELAPEMTPYRFGFNNPILYSDPLGLFESREEAREYADENDIKTGLFRRNKIKKQNDGSFAIENRGDHSSTYKDSEFGVVTGALAVAPKGGIFGIERRETESFLSYLFTGGVEDGIKYNRDGYATGIAPLSGSGGLEMIGGGGIKLIESFSRVRRGFTISRKLRKKATNQTLKNIITNITKGGKTTFSAVRNEMRTGLPTKGKFHTQKLIETRRALQKLWRNRRNLNDTDRKIVKHLLNASQKTLSRN